MAADRYLILAPTYPPDVGGIEGYLSGLAAALGPERAVVLAPASERAAAVDRSSPVPVERVADGGGPAGAIAWLRAIVGARRRHRVTRLVAGHVRLGPIAWLAARSIGLPLVVVAYGMEITAGRFGRVKSWVWRRADRLVTISRYSADRLVEAGAPRERIALLPPGLGSVEPPDPAAVERLREGLGLCGRPVLLTVARLDGRERYKGHDRVLAALPSVLARHADLVYLVAGAGDDRGRLEGEARRFGLGEAVRFLGPVAAADLPVLFAVADIFVMPSRVVADADGLKFEGFGIVYLEAGRAGRPVVAGRAGGAVDAVEDGVTGRLVDPEDPAAIAGALDELLSDPLRARAMGAAGAARVAGTFAWSRLPVAERLGQGDR